MAKDWRVVIQDWGGVAAGWPSVWSDEEDRSVIHTDGFKQEYWDGPTMKEAMAIANLVADFMNRGGVSSLKKQESPGPHNEKWVFEKIRDRISKDNGL